MIRRSAMTIFGVVAVAVVVWPAVAQQADANAGSDNTAHKDKAMKILLAAAVGDDPALRSNALEAMQVYPARALPLTQRGLADPNPGVRFAAVVTAGRLKFAGLIPAIRPLVHDTNPSVKAAALSALSTLGDTVDITPLAGMLTGPDPALRANVAMLLGILGDPSAIPLLKQAAAAPMPRVGAERAAVVRIQIAEAIARLGDDTSLDALRAGAFSQFDEVRAVAIMAMGQIGDQRMEVALRNILDDPPVELRVAAAASLARIGSEVGLPQVLEVVGSENYVVRAQVAWTLGWFKNARADGHLVTMLEDPEAMVRVAAAASILRRATPPAGA